MANALKAATAYFAIIFAAGFMLGTLRVFLLVPRLGEAAAVLIELPVILLVSWFVCRSLVGRFAVPALAQARLAMGGIAFALLMGAELALAVFVFDRSLAGHWQHYTTLSGSLGLAGQIAFAAFLYLQMKLRGR